MALNILWHNPRCSKSRATLAIAEAYGPVTIRKYLDDAPSAEEIKQVLELLDLKAAEFIRRCEPEFKALGLSHEDSEDKLIQAMARTPKLIERPVLLADGKARIGRPPELVHEIL